MLCEVLEDGMNQHFVASILFALIFNEDINKMRDRGTRLCRPAFRKSMLSEDVDRRSLSMEHRFGMKQYDWNDGPIYVPITSASASAVAIVAATAATTTTMRPAYDIFLRQEQNI
ncbi:hypothetical protein V1478_013281 [Vespula squamosa]|uniref:Uncharacterized protein n=1 Tax=Vespula squamosa TaxID=30214 RepID=A0ABD2AAC9_VESSQ